MVPSKDLEDGIKKVTTFPKALRWTETQITPAFTMKGVKMVSL